MNTMEDNTYLGLDVGDRRIGVAVSHLGFMASPLEVIQRDGNEIARISALVAEYRAAGVVAGMPYSLDGTLKPQARKVQAFLEELTLALNVPVYTVDERLTTCQANRALIESGRRSKERKAVVDQVAASLILQTFLDRGTSEGCSA
jgi:putative Holliday junction resolvase